MPSLLFAAFGLVAVAQTAEPVSDATTLYEYRQLEPGKLKPSYGIRWQARLGQFELLKTYPEEWTRPAISPDGARVYLGTRGGRLEARAMADGRLLWSKNDLGTLGADILEHRSVVLVGVDADLVAFSRSDGTERWRKTLGGRIGGEMVVTGTVAILPVRPNGFLAVDLLAEGQVLWQVQRPTPEGLSVRGHARATVDRKRGVAYLGFSEGTLLAVDLVQGTTRWALTLGNTAEYFADVDANPVLVDGGAALLVAAYNSGLFRVNAEQGAIEWNRPLMRLIDLVPLPRVGLVVAAHGEGELIGLRPRDGAVVWRYRMGDGAPATPRALPGERVAVVSSRGPLGIVSARTGRPEQVLSTGSGSSVPPAVRGSDLVLFSNHGLALALRDGGGSNVLLR